MGFFVVRRALAVRGGSAQFGADTNVFRSAANMLKTDDGFTVGGTPLLVPYGAASPTLDVNGDLRIYHKSNVARLAFYSGGTAYVMALPTTTNGTLTLTVNAVP